MTVVTPRDIPDGAAHTCVVRCSQPCRVARHPLTPRPPEEAVFARLGSWCFRRRKTVVLLWIAGVVVVGGLSSAIGGSFGQDFQPPGFESTRGLDTLNDRVRRVRRRHPRHRRLPGRAGRRRPAGQGVDGAAVRTDRRAERRSRRRRRHRPGLRQPDRGAARGPRDGRPRRDAGDADRQPVQPGVGRPPGRGRRRRRRRRQDRLRRRSRSPATTGTSVGDIGRALEKILPAQPTASRSRSAARPSASSRSRPRRPSASPSPWSSSWWRSAR